ncbi:MFS transporter [Anoxybacillus sp. EFIL]|uniref:MDR family MFS transporter n=1 Tax=Anoxybacillus sp. EFIL TaxID=2508869 RepID=UPI00148C4D10|nr:MFS transporter [Anoxybacillus sp. EFIL]NNU97740.1 MFS transporter [Anoxybacillus sp. EFIL]
MKDSIKKLSTEVRIVLFGVLLIGIGYFMAIPLLSLYLSNYRGLSVFQIGLVLTVLTISQQGFTFFGGILSDRFGVKNSLIYGMLIRIIGFLTFAFSNNSCFFVISSIFVGIGGALFFPASKAIIATVPNSVKSEAFALRSIAVNIGASIGPLLGGLLYKFEFKIVFLCATLVHFIFLLLALKYVDKNHNNINSNMKIVSQLNKVIKDYKIVFLMLINSGFWALYSQVYITIPLDFTTRFNSDSLVSLLFSINGFLVIILQYRMVKWMNKKFNQSLILTFGMILMAFAFFSLSIFPSIYAFFTFIIFFTISEILIIPTIDDLTSNISPPGLAGSYLGFVSLGTGIGSLFGNLIGGSLFEQFKSIDLIWVNWLIYALFSMFIALLFKIYPMSKHEKCGYDPNRFKMN